MMSFFLKLISTSFYFFLLISDIVFAESSNYTYEQMYSTLDHYPNDQVFGESCLPRWLLIYTLLQPPTRAEILRGRCNVDTPFTASLSLSSSPVTPLTSDHVHAGSSESCGEMSYRCTGPSIRDMCDMITNMNAPTCSCADDCGNYSSCCWDHEFPADDMVRLQEVTRVNECRRPFFRESRDAFMIRSSCSFDWSSRSDSGYIIKDACEEVDRLSVKDRLQALVNGSNFEKDFLSEVIVTSARTAITYKNIFCLVCNFDFYEDTSDDDLIFWPITVKCLQKPESAVADVKAGCILDHRVNGINPSHETYEIYRKSLIPCYADDDGIISDCPHSYNYDMDQLMTRVRCGTIFSPVRHVDGKNTNYYKNEWCARCHGVAPDAIRCMDGYLPRRAGQSPKKQDEQKYDIVYDNITVTAERRRGGRSERQCKPIEILDPFIGACRTFLCHRHEDCRLVSSNYSAMISICRSLFLLITFAAIVPFAAVMK